jgi:hypothetical protein
MMYHPRQSSRKESTLQRIARVAVGVSLAVMVAQAVSSDAVARKAPAPPTDQAAERERMAKFNKAVDTLNFPRPGSTDSGVAGRATSSGVSTTSSGA